MRRENQVLVKLDDKELAMLERVSKESGLARADVIRQLIREHERRFGKRTSKGKQ